MPTASFSVRVTIRSQESERQRDNRNSFWMGVALKQRYGNSDAPTPDLLEARFERDFGSELRSLLISHFSSAWAEHKSHEHLSREASSYELEQRRHLSLIIFQARVQRYASLDFSVELAGLHHIVKLFDGNFELFQMFLTSYIPIAFAEALDHWELAPADYQVTIPRTVQDEFQASPAQEISKPTSKEASLSDNRTRWIWMLTNASLVVPVLLSLAVLYVAAMAAREDQDALTKRLEIVQKKEDALFNTQTRRLEILEAALLPPKAGIPDSASTSARDP